MLLLMVYTILSKDRLKIERERDPISSSYTVYYRDVKESNGDRIITIRCENELQIIILFKSYLHRSYDILVQLRIREVMFTNRSN